MRLADGQHWGIRQNGYVVRVWTSDDGDGWCVVSIWPPGAQAGGLYAKSAEGIALALKRDEAHRMSEAQILKWRRTGQG